MGSEWIVGAYVLYLEETNQRVDTGTCAATVRYRGVCSTRRPSSHYDATNLAFFGELGRPLGARTRLTGGLRWSTATRSTDSLSPPGRPDGR